MREKTKHVSYPLNFYLYKDGENTLVFGAYRINHRRNVFRILCT